MEDKAKNLIEVVKSCGIQCNNFKEYSEEGIASGYYTMLDLIEANEKFLDARAKSVLTIIRQLGLDCETFRNYGKRGLDKGFFSEDDIDKAATEYVLNKINLGYID